MAHSLTPRDLSKPIGALNPERLDHLKKRYKVLPEDSKYLFGTHYSTPGYVIGYKLRSNPWYMLKLQSWKFDVADRLFYSIESDWENCFLHECFKELIPEFFMPNADFLKNKLNLELGRRQNKESVGDVQLPKWANKDPNFFLFTNRKALESEYVSRQLHLWIDLIFGYKQRGEEALKANNLFHPRSYEGSIDLDSFKGRRRVTEEPFQIRAMKAQINEFGQTPKQIFDRPHAKRRTKMILNKPISQRPTADSKQEERQREDQRGREADDKTSIRDGVSTKLEEKTGIENSSSKLSSFNNITNEIYDLVEETNDNLKDAEEKQGKEKWNKEYREDDILGRPTKDLYKIMQDVKNSMPESESAQSRLTNDDVYFNFVSSKSFDFKKDRVHQGSE